MRVYCKCCGVEIEDGYDYWGDDIVCFPCFYNCEDLGVCNRADDTTPERTVSPLHGANMMVAPQFATEPFSWNRVVHHKLFT